MTSERYNSLINFNKMIEITSKNFSSNIILHEKEEILKMAVKAGSIRKRGDTLEYWDMYFAVLSGSYLYFYPEDVENADSYDSWIYLKDAVITIDRGDEEDEAGHIFLVSNSNTTLYLYANDEREVKEWIKCIREKVYEIGSINDSFSNKTNNKEHEKGGSFCNLEDIPEISIFSVNLYFENVEYNMINDDYTKFLNFKISDMSLKSETTTRGEFSSYDGMPKSINNQYSQICQMEIKKISIYDTGNEIIMIESFNPLNLTVSILSKSAKAYKGDKVVIDFKVDFGRINFLPKSFKQMITFFKRVNYEGANASMMKDCGRVDSLNESLRATVNLRLNKSRRMNIMESDDSNDNMSKITDDDDIVTLTTKNVLKLNIVSNKLKMTLINPINMNPFVHINIDRFSVVYELFQVHHQLNMNSNYLSIS